MVRNSSKSMRGTVISMLSTAATKFTLLPLLNPDRDNLARIPLPAFPRQGEQSPRSCIGLQARLGLTGFDIAALIRNPG
jgi:hypothetical protein